MDGSTRLAHGVLFVCLLAGAAVGQRSAKNAEILPPSSYKPPLIENSPELQTLLNTAVGETVNAFLAKGFKMDEIAATLIDLNDPARLKLAEVRGTQRIYP